MKFLVIGGKTSDKTAIRNSLSDLNGLMPDVQFAGPAMEGLFKIRSIQPDFVLVDELVLESEEILLQMRQAKTDSSIFVLVTEDKDERACELIKSGATDIFPRDELGTERFRSLVVRLSQRLKNNQIGSAELSKSNSRLLSVADNLSTMTWLSDESGERFLFNDKWLGFVGHKLGQELGRKWLDSIHPQDLKKFWAIYSQSIRSRKSYHIEYRLRRSDGQFRLILESGTPMSTSIDANGFIGFMGSCADVSETRYTQHDMPAMDMTTQLSTTLDHAPIGVWKLDTNLVITKANPAVATLFSVEPEHLVGRQFQEIVSSVPENAFVSVLERGERIQLENYPVTLTIDKERRQMFLDLAAWPLKDKSNNVVGVCVSTTEVTERHLQVQQKEDFVATLVHDLKTPLIGADRALEQMIKGSLGPIDPSQAELLTMLKRSNHHLLAMVQNLIEVYRYDAGEARFMMEEFSLSDLIVGSMQELDAWADHKQIALKHNMREGSAVIVADRLSIRRVFLNLLDNALKFTNSGGEVKVMAQETDTIVTVRVTDTGVGIPEHEQSKLFLRYWQGHTAKAFSPGTGLGLYLCRQIVTAHGGDIKVSSTEKIGTTFSIVLPKQAMPRVL